MDYQANRTKYQNDRAAREYDEIRYAGWRGRLKNALHASVLRRAFRDVPRGGIVVDVPCGTGRFTGWLRDEGYQVIAADISANMLEVAREKTVNGSAEGILGFHTADAEHLPYADDSIDATLTVRFFHLVPADVRKRVYKELARVTKGQVILCVNCNKWSLKILSKRIRGKSSPYWMSRSELTRELAEGGLAVERIHTKGGFLSTLWVVVCRPT